MVNPTLEELRVNPEQPFWVYHQLGQKFVQQNLFAEAHALYQQAIQQHPNNPQLYQFLGIIQEKLGDRIGQIGSYRQAIDLDPNQPFWLYTTLGNLLSQQGELIEALELYQEALQRYPDRANANVYVQFGDVLAQLGNSEDAISAYRRALELQPDRDWIDYRIDAQRYILGIHALNNHQILAAIAQFQQIDRVQNLELISLPWFIENGVSWPQRCFSWREDLEKLKPAHVDWVRITVVTPSFNQGEYIEETLLSVLNQNYPNLEYIVVDGDSTDQTRSILESYRERLAKLIIEPDGGQSEAINKGFKRSTGELLIWINSDDMLAPGALHLAALTYLKLNCDLVAGICLVHNDRQITAMRLPKVRQADFTVECLSDVARKWSSGHFFFQPEVFFSRRIWERSGSQLNESLYYAMDHDLWLRFAEQGATLEIIGYPMALFRKHEAQKTANQMASVQELLQVTGSYRSTSLAKGRSAEIAQKIYTFLHSSPRRILILTERIEQIADKELSLFELTDDQPYQIWVSNDPKTQALDEFDAIILIVHLKNELETLKILQSSGFSGLLIGWFWDNQFRYDFNIRVAEQVDVSIPTQGFIAEVLRNSWSELAPAISRCSTQWKTEEVKDLFERYGTVDRSNCLDGKFANDRWALRRNELIEQVRQILPDSHLNWIENARDYFTLSYQERFHQWIHHKVSLCLPIEQELPCRVFDALICGLVPIVPADVFDLDTVISQTLQAELPIIRFQEHSAESVVAAYREALDRFDADGELGIQRRHNFGVEKHMWTNRLKSIIGFLKNADAASTQSSSDTLESPARAESDSEAQTPLWRYFEMGQDLEKQENWTEAISLYQETAKVYPDHADVFRALGIVQDRLGEVEGVVENYCRAIELDPQQPIWVYLTLCRFLTEQQKFEESIELHQAALQRYPEHPELYRSLGIAWEKQGNSEGVIENYRRATEAEPKQPIWVYLTLGRLLRETEKLEESVEIHQKALQFYADKPNVYSSLGVTLEKKGDEEGVIQNYRRALELDRQQPIWVYLTLGRLLRERNLLEDSIAIHQASVELYGDRAEAYGALGIAQESAGEVDAAIASYRRAIALNVDSPLWLYLALGELLLQREQMTKAIDLYQHLQQTYPTNPAVYRALGIAQQKQEDLAGAIASYQQAISLQSDRHLWVYMTLGQLFRDEERFDEAIVLYESAAENFPQSAEIYRALGTIYSQIDRLEEASNSYRQAIALEPNGPVWVYLTLGQLLTDSKQLPEAIFLYQDALNLNPENPDLYRMLGTAQKENNDRAGAIVSYQQAIKLQPDSAVWVYLALAELLKEEDRCDEAIAVCEAAVQLFPDAAEVYRSIATLQNQTHQLEAATVSYRQAIALEPNGPAWVYMTLGQLLEEQDDVDTAIALYEEASEIYPEQADFPRAIGLAQKKKEM